MLKNKVLILGTALNYTNASSITASNLFSGWQKCDLLIVAPYKDSVLSSILGYSNVYSLGSKEVSFIFKLWYNSVYSGALIHDKKEDDKFLSSSSAYRSPINSSLNKYLSRLANIFTKSIIAFADFFGFGYILYRFNVSQQLDDWIIKGKPNFVYTQLGSWPLMLFAKQIHQKHNIPLITHIMDDWPTTMVSPGLLAFYWRKKIDKEFRELLKLSYKTVAISEKMAFEYQNRYGGNWRHYHNPIDTERWLPFQKKDYSLRKTIKIGYFGRIGIANSTTIKRFIEVVQSIKEINIEFHVYSQDNSKKARNTYYHPFVEYSRIPEVVSSYDMLLLPLGFSKYDTRFAKYSIPTKASEYMISGVPVILIAPEGMALTEFFDKHNCGLIINSEKPQVIKKALIKFINDQPQRELFSRNGIEVAQKLFDINSVHESFKEIFT